MLSIAGVIGIVSLLPAFVHATLEERSAERVLAPLRLASDTGSTTETTVEVSRQANMLAIFNDSSGGKTDYSYIVKSIVGVRGVINIYSIAVSRTSTSTIVAFVQGTAANREALLAFKGRLESAVLGNKVDLPVSQLAKSSNIQFSLSVRNNSTP
jgi:hypothetical protein